jgi:hypothetical protein
MPQYFIFRYSDIRTCNKSCLKLNLLSAYSGMKFNGTKIKKSNEQGRKKGTKRKSET